MDGKIAAYRTADTMGKSQIDLILMVYDGALKALRTATQAYRDDDADAGYEEMGKVEKFVTHLYSTLDMDKGGEVAANLAKMYVWVITQTHIIRATKDLEQLDAVAAVLENLRSAWAEIKTQTTDTTEAAPTTRSEAPEQSVLTEEFVTTA